MMEADRSGKIGGGIIGVRMGVGMVVLVIGKAADPPPTTNGLDMGGGIKLM